MTNSKSKDYRFAYKLNDWTHSWRKAGMKRVQGGLRRRYNVALARGEDVVRVVVMAL